jgi:hypothetical protein
MMDAYGICGVSENIEKTVANQNERNRGTDNDDNIIWRNIDANCLLDVKEKYLYTYCTLP